MSFSIGDLHERDLSRGFLETLQSLAEVDLTPDAALHVFHQRLRAGAHTYVARIGDKTVGSVTILVEYKFIHRGSRAAHLEDVAVHRDYQKLGIGAALVRHAIDEARRLGCYKVILNCFDKLIPFYARFGFRRQDNGMRLNL
jgi:glucosamine-phosphate N-acetyltransferase